MPWTKHRGGPIDSDFLKGWEGRLLAELAYEEPKEDLAITVLHESGWYLAVLPDGNVLLDNSEEGGTEPQTALLHEDDLVGIGGRRQRGYCRGVPHHRGRSGRRLRWLNR